MQYPGATGCGARRNYIHPCLHKAKKNHASMCTNGKRLRSCFWIYRAMIWDEFLRHFRFCDEEDSGLSDEEQERKGPKNRPKHTRKRIHQAKKNFLKKFKTASNCHII